MLSAEKLLGMSAEEMEAIDLGVFNLLIEKLSDEDKLKIAGVLAGYNLSEEEVRVDELEQVWAEKGDLISGQS